MNTSSEDLEMKRYLELEIPHYLHDSIQGIEAVGDFSFPLADKVEAKMKVYEVILGSGRKVFAVEGGWQGKVRNVYGNELPDAETAAKVHVFTLVKLLERENPDAKGLAEDIADGLNLSEQFRKTG